jgi:hypothetical protein
VIRGVNPWRRALGIGGCAFVIARATTVGAILQLH